jgi:opacity protein-like surface antigen
VRKLLLGCLGALSVLGAIDPVAAQSPPQGFYLSFNPGAAISEPNTGRPRDPIPVPGGRFLFQSGQTYHTGSDLEFAFGYRYSEALRAQFDFGWVRRDLHRAIDAYASSTFVAPTFVGVSDDIFIGTLSGFYDIRTGSFLTPYIGAGLGVGAVKHIQAGSRDTDTNLAISTEVGVTAALYDHIEVDPAFRFRWINSAQAAFPGGDDLLYSFRFTF